MNYYNKTKLYPKTKNCTNSGRIIQIALHESFIADTIRCACFDAFYRGKKNGHFFRYVQELLYCEFASFIWIATNQKDHILCPFSFHAKNHLLFHARIKSIVTLAIYLVRKTLIFDTKHL